MKVGIISDIHGYPNLLKKALKIMNDCNIILCAGDVLNHGPRNPILNGYDPQEVANIIKSSNIPFLIAKGNCDSEVDSMVLNLPIMEYVFYKVDNTTFMVNHGHNKSKEELIDLAKYYKADVVIKGHSHIRENEIIDKIHYINPSSIVLPKDELPGSVAIYTNGKVEFYDI